MNKEEIIYPSMVIRSQSEAIELLEKENQQLKETIKNQTIELNRLNEEQCNTRYNQLKRKYKQLKEKINTYENPEDLTLMFMYCDEKAKDKIKQLKEELKATKEVVEEHLKKEIQLKEVIEEVREYIKENRTRYIYEDNLGEDWWFEDLDVYNDLLQILDKGENNE